MIYCGPTASRRPDVRFLLHLRGKSGILSEFDIRKNNRGADYGFETGIEAAGKLLSMEEPPTAILCFSDIIALGVINGANELGKRVPEDVSVTGFDDVDYTKMLHPYLTTVKQPCYELGKKSVELLINKINMEECEQEIHLPYEIKMRESTRKID